MNTGTCSALRPYVDEPKLEHDTLEDEALKACIKEFTANLDILPTPVKAALFYSFHVAKNFDFKRWYQDRRARRDGPEDPVAESEAVVHSNPMGKDFRIVSYD